VKPEEDESVWWIPLGLKTGPQATDAQREALTSKEDTYRDIDTSFYKVNADQTGFYRTNLPPQRLAHLSGELNKLSVQDKIGLVGDAGALAVAGEGTTAAVLSFVEGFTNETNYLVWSEVLSTLGKIRSVFSADKDASEGLRNFTLKLVSAATDKIGWDFAPGDDYLKGQLRALLLQQAGLAGHEQVVAEAQKRFKAFVEGDKKAIHPSLRGAVYRIAVKNGGKDAYEAVLHEYKTTSSIDGKEICLHSLGQVQSADLAKAYLSFAFSGGVGLQDIHSVASSLGANNKVNEVLWTFIKDEWSDIKAKLSGNTIMLERFLRMGLQKFASFEVQKDITAFFEDKDTKGFDRGLAVVSDTITGNARYRERDVATVKAWLTAHKYA